MSQEKLFLGLVGEAGSGKNAVAKIIEEKYKAEIITSSSLLKEALSVFLDEISREDYIWFVKILTKKYGEDIISKAVIKRMHAAQNKIVVFNGVRLPSDYEYLNRNDGKLIYVTASAKTRWQRVTQRGEKADDKAPFEEFLKNEKTKTEKNIPLIGAKADYKIDNEGTFEDLRRQADEVMSKIIEN